MAVAATLRCRTLLVEKTDRLYRNIKDWVTIDELGIEVHFVKEAVGLSEDSRSSEKFMHGIRANTSTTTAPGIAVRAATRTFAKRS